MRSHWSAREDLGDGRGIVDGGEEPQAAAASGAGQHVEGFADQGCFRGCTMNFRADFSFSARRSGDFQIREFIVRSPETGTDDSERCAATVFVQVTAN